ncbi:membrane fusion protein (multidrug efflux system) [Methylohalomonas lacus]|uniref:Membrane fusion protein (Multidrug efflux system) n=1 Tax=Methylohalomonas lacus TaxID=398773 RepID=A0AAE3HLB5_9GAMM|nr:efflux RND transporter periplasmic adaptor subunit [Methylohalomonas lacus]MCS3904354.1 membrane fusion protein (multidrug efflux system) [Methylohalomonas lacus]
MFLRLILMLLIVGGIIGGVYYMKMQQWEAMSEMAEQGQPPATIASTTVTEESWQPRLNSVGSMVAVNDVSVTNEVPGIVEEIQFESGQRVEKGDVLLQIDDNVDRAQLEGLKADLQLAQVQFDRAAKLVKERTVSQSEFDEAKARLESARANLASSKAEMVKKSIRAPFSGIIGIRQIDLGQYLAAGSEIAPLQSLDPIYVDYTLPERHLSDLSVGQTIDLNVQAYPGQTFSGRIEALNPGIDPGTRSIHIRGVLDNPDGTLRPGMFAEIRTLLSEQNDILTLPQQAITYAPYGDSVFVIEEQDGQKVVQRRQVKTGAVRNGRVEILEGLELGDEVASAGQNKLRNGQPVQINNDIEVNDKDAVSSP